ncbi:unnamed protein product [Symbiodinium sp. CCMP2592]|nr:unnamed protein product [Symbiodinium sp. CCMP2592]CAE7739182.1 unnamed protein product [Symbiodinium sp. CCMP2592]
MMWPSKDVLCWEAASSASTSASDADLAVGVREVRKSWLVSTARTEAWRDELDEARNAALQMWKAIILQSVDSTKLGKILQTVGDAEELEASLRDTFAGKATSTLTSRAGSLLIFAKWKSTTLGTDVGAIFPMSEKEAYSYLCQLRREGAPRSRAVKFVEAVGFAKGMIGSDVDAVLTSPRVKGACSPVVPNPPVRKKAPLLLREIVFIEKLAVSADPFSQDAIIAGYVCVLLRCRLRWSDGMHMESEPTLDLCGNGDGFFEGRLDDHKTSAAMGFKVLPVVAVLPGVSGLSWAEHHLSNRKKQGLVAGPGKPFQPATILSWLSRAPAPSDIQRRAGYHLAAGERDPAEYERDGQTAVLHFIQGVMMCIAQGFFCPDAQRSGRWSGCRSVDEGVAIIAGHTALSTGPPDLDAKSDDGDESEVSECGDGGHSEAEEAAAETVVHQVSQYLASGRQDADTQRHHYSGVIL